MTKNELIILLVSALSDICDGQSIYDLEYSTGLPLERCEEIKDIFYRSFRSYDHRGFDIEKLLREFEVNE